MYAYKNDKLADLLAQLERWLAEPNLRESLAPRHQQLLRENVDVAEWFTNFLLAGMPRPTFHPPG
jgi:hypothetical protein